MFIQSKYSRAYYSIIQKALLRKVSDDLYHEKHHIVPKSLGGSNDKNNLVRLTFREHYICHRLLVKMTFGDDRRKMACALWAMTRKTGKRNYSSRQYSLARNIYILHHPNTHLSEEKKIERGKKISKSMKGKSNPHAAKNLEKYNQDIADGKRPNPFTKTWKVRTPSGEVIIVNNLAKFCREHALSKGNMSSWGYSKGYTVTPA